MGLTAPLPIRVFSATQEYYFLEGKITPSGRWAAAYYPNGRKIEWMTVHLPTGMPARFGLTATEARKLTLAFEDLETPALDGLGFGELASSEAQKEDLRKLLPHIKALWEKS